MPVIESAIDTRADAFRANADAMRAQVADLDRVLARIAEGGGAGGALAVAQGVRHAASLSAPGRSFQARPPAAHTSALSAASSHSISSEGCESGGAIGGRAAADIVERLSQRPVLNWRRC
jgi:hypothetical protein